MIVGQSLCLVSARCAASRLGGTTGLVFGSFRIDECRKLGSIACAWCSIPECSSNHPTRDPCRVPSGDRYPGRSGTAACAAVADSRQLRYWRLLGHRSGVGSRGRAGSPLRMISTGRPRPAAGTSAESAETCEYPASGPTGGNDPPAAVEDSLVQMFDVDVGAQARTFFEGGLRWQSRFHPSFSIQRRLLLAWDRRTAEPDLRPFYRHDAEDDERTHFDIREVSGRWWATIGICIWG